MSSQSWSSLLVLLEQSPRTTTGLGVRLCQPLSTMVVQQPSLSDRAMAILETMTDDALNEFSTEVCVHHQCVCVCFMLYSVCRDGMLF